MDYQTLLNSNIKNLRKNLKLTQEEFSQKIGITLQGLSNIERNRYQPTAQTIDKICKVFKLSPIELLSNPSKEKSEVIQNITILLSQLSKSKLNKLYKIISLMVKL